MASSEDPATFLVRAAAALVRLDLTLGPDDQRFRELVVHDMVDGIPVPRPLEGLHEHLLAGADPVEVLSDAFAKQAAAYSEAAARATVAVAQVAVDHLYAAGGDAAVAAFLDDLQSHNGSDEHPPA